MGGRGVLQGSFKKVLQNKAQLEEWERLGFGKFESEWDLVGKKLPIDTGYFDERFKWELLERISERVNLDDALDGLLIKSENWQALNTILNRYKEKVQTIYIDPPFNKEQDADYLYNVKYKDSTWIAMLENRLRLAKELLNERGSIFVRCDYNGNMYVRLLMNEIFGEENFRNEIVVIFKTENSEILLKRVIESTSDEGDLVMDFFLGSGTTTAVAHKLKRKWIGVEMGEHFWTVVMPRMKKVLAYDKSGISKEKDVKEKYNERTAGGFFKYIILEQYEDTLDNLELKESKAHKDFFKDELPY
jgi:adenine specific DNA methylase Mod